MSGLKLVGPIAVIDVETTGLFPKRHDRIIEIAVVVIGTNGRIEREFETLLNPGRDLGPTSVHNIAAEDVIHAPCFGDIASHLFDCLQGVIAIAAHNVRFDRQFLESEMLRISVAAPRIHALCTMQFGGGSNLAHCCAAYNVAGPCEAHTALSDARAAARLLIAQLQKDTARLDELFRCTAIEWPALARGTGVLRTRSGSRQQRAEVPTFLQRLLALKGDSHSSSDDGAALAYGALLDRVLEDRRVDETESEALVETATTWGLTGESIARVHTDYLHQLARAALTDGHVSTCERNDLLLVARLLGKNPQDLEKALDNAASKLISIPHRGTSEPTGSNPFAGRSVCFTGELQSSIAGKTLTRERAEHLAVEAGLHVMANVTKKLDILVVADPHTQSGKARKAQQYGIRVLHETVFWQALGIKVA